MELDEIVSALLVLNYWICRLQNCPIPPDCRIFDREAIRYPASQ